MGIDMIPPDFPFPVPHPLPITYYRLPPYMLELAAIHKRFGTTRALDRATLLVRPGSVHALLGENGAGKTTLMRIAFGELRPDAGSVRIAGSDARLRSPADAIARGVGMVHQHFALVPAMTVAENVALGGRGLFHPASAAERVRRLGEETGLVLDPDARVAELGVAAQQRAEIVKALARDARLLVLDEPTAVLAPAEAGELLRWLRRYADAGNAVVLITHKLREAISVADDVTVLRRGRTVATMAAAEATETSLAAAMLGAGQNDAARGQRVVVDAAGEANVVLGGGPPMVGARDARDAARPHVPYEATRPVVITADRLLLRDERGVERIRDATFRIAAGEIVGVAAVEGSGQRELLRALAGRLAPSSGALHLPPRVGFVPEDRHEDALVLDFALHENVALRGLGARRGVIAWREMEAETRGLMTAFDVRAAGPRVPARTLSGGNQQKLVLARELADAPAALVVENPTRGLDIRASAAVRDRLRQARDAGTAVVLHSGDLDETLALADRILVVHAGRVSEAPRDRDVVGRMMLGAE